MIKRKSSLRQFKSQMVILLALTADPLPRYRMFQFQISMTLKVYLCSDWIFSAFSAIRWGVSFYSTPKNYMRSSDCDVTNRRMAFALNLNKNMECIWFWIRWNCSGWWECWCMMWMNYFNVTYFSQFLINVPLEAMRKNRMD